MKPLWLQTPQLPKCAFHFFRRYRPHRKRPKRLSSTIVKSPSMSSNIVVPLSPERAGVSADLADKKFVRQMKEEMFTIDDGDEGNEGHFVQDTTWSEERISFDDQ
ncbi:hypothetical protein PsorP6_004477 [Peronosclerospora sorghi]|uniref:Uncharacterized protein n=1 Tax=Peronosclerospora sorghi TaxID=230839 RepID=A0ACC0VPR9_9STRA|nr:hypothetical protein PsorP6_004477 [Peronosclerospora sorghi]